MHNLRNAGESVICSSLGLQVATQVQELEEIQELMLEC